MREIIGRKRILDSLTAEALAGHCVLLCGPMFIGKTSVLRKILVEVRRRGRPCGYAPHTETVHDVTQAVLKAYPDAVEPGLGQARLRSRLRRAVESAPGVVLLDHLQSAGTTLKSFLRSFRGTGQGVIIAADVEEVRDHVRLRTMRLAHRERWLPPLPRRYIVQLLEAKLASNPLPRALVEADRAALVQIGAGRPGIIEILADRLRAERFWHQDRVRAATLRNEVSIAVAQAYMDAIAARVGRLGS